MPFPTSVRRAAVSLCGAALLAGCQVYTPFRDPNGRANDDMQAVVFAYDRLGAKPVSRLTVAQARSQPTMDDAVRQVVSAQRRTPWVADGYTQERDITVSGAAGPLYARVYDATPGKRNEPIILFFHDGGFVTGSYATSDLTARALATQAHAKVVSVDYRLGPEARFPAAQDDAFAAYRWVLLNTATIGGDRRRIAVAGEGAGGNLAINVSMMARDYHYPAPVHQLLISPVAYTDFGDPSYIADEYAQPLGRADMRWYFINFVRSREDLHDPRLDLVGRADLRGLPSTTIISAEMDPLQSEGTFLTYKLQAEGNQVDRVLYGGTVHDFFGAGAAVARAKEAEAYAAQHLDAVFDGIGEPKPPRNSYYIHGPVRHRIGYGPPHR